MEVVSETYGRVDLERIQKIMERNYYKSESVLMQENIPEYLVNVTSHSVARVLFFPLTSRSKNLLQQGENMNTILRLFGIPVLSNYSNYKHDDLYEFYNGVIYCQFNSKSAIISHFLTKHDLLHPNTTVIFIDNTLKKCTDVAGTFPNATIVYYTSIDDADAHPFLSHSEKLNEFARIMKLVADDLWRADLNMLGGYIALFVVLLALSFVANFAIAACAWVCFCISKRRKPARSIQYNRYNSIDGDK